MTATVNSIATAGDRELVISRTFDAPRNIVFEAWSRAEHLVRWFGPSAFSLPSCVIDFRVGGSYRFCMRSPEGEDHWVWGEYREIVVPERIVFTWNRDDSSGEIWSRTVVELMFVENDGLTQFTLRQGLFETTPFCDEHQIGWNQCLDRLADFAERSYRSL